MKFYQRGAKISAFFLGSSLASGSALGLIFSIASLVTCLIFIIYEENKQ